MELLSKARIKFIQSLQHKKFRLKYDKFIVEGLKINKELGQERPHIIESVYVSNPDSLRILENTIPAELLIPISPDQMRQLSLMTTPPGILSVCSIPKMGTLPENLEGKKIFYLDAIRDPGNMGAILRISDWFGLDYVLCSPDCVDLYNPKVIVSSMGSAMRVQSYEIVLEELLKAVEAVYVCDMEGTNLFTVDPPTEGVIVFGNESQGVSDQFEGHIKQILSIPGNKSLGAESLNVASAAAIVASWWSQS
jgi:TrmH family RNA methyltransferase